MKKIIILFFTVLLLLNFSCKKKTDSSDQSSDSQVASSDNSTNSNGTEQYVKYSTYIYKNDGDLGKKSEDVKEKKLLEFGNKVIIKDTKKSGDQEYAKVKLPDNSEFWVDKIKLCEKFITINQPDVSCYKQPDTGYLNAHIKLQPGDFAYFVKEQDGFINVDFINYMPRGKNKSITWIGNVWLKEGYTEDLSVAKEAYILSLAYKELFSKNQNKEKALEKLKTAVDINGGTETEITYVIKNLINELEGKPPVDSASTLGDE